MTNPQRLLLIASPLMRRTPVYDRAAALAKAKGMPLHIVAFDYLEGLATAGLVNEQAWRSCGRAMCSNTVNGWKPRHCRCAATA